MTRRTIPQEERKIVYKKCCGHCAYCGKEIMYKQMQVDHLVPLRKGGTDSIENYLPACRQCNHYKSTYDIEQFRKELGLIKKRLRNKVYIYNLAVQYGLVSENNIPIVFYFENFNGSDNN